MYKIQFHVMLNEALPTGAGVGLPVGGSVVLGIGAASL